MGKREGGRGVRMNVDITKSPVSPNKVLKMCGGPNKTARGGGIEGGREGGNNSLYIHALTIYDKSLCQ